MSRKILFVGMILVLLVSFSAVLADQDGNARWCNSDQYGCWVTGENGSQDYIMFWSESARELFMGPGSNAPIADPYPGGKMALQSAGPKGWQEFISDYFNSKVNSTEGYWYGLGQKSANSYAKSETNYYEWMVANNYLKAEEVIDDFVNYWSKVENQ